MQNNCIHTFIPLDKNHVLFRSQLRRKEQNKDLENGSVQLLFVCMCVYACVFVCHMLQFWEPQEVPQCFVLYCFVAFVQWVFTHPWCNRLSMFVLEGFHLPWNHKPQLLDFHIILQLLCYFMGCLSMSGAFIYDTRNRIAGITCTLLGEWPVSESPFVWGKVILWQKIQ